MDNTNISDITTIERIVDAFDKIVRDNIKTEITACKTERY